MSTVAAQVLLLLRDGSGSPGRMVANIPAGENLAVARPAIASLAGLLASVTGCSVEGYSITYRTHLSDAKPGSAAPGNSLLRLVFQAGDEYFALSIAGLRSELVGEDDYTVDPEQPEVASLVAAIISGVWCSPFGEDVLSLLASYKEFQP